MHSSEFHLSLEASKTTLPQSPKQVLRTETRVWDLLLGEKVGNGARGVAWRVTGTTEGNNRKITGFVKEYNDKNVKSLDRDGKMDTASLIKRNIATYSYMKHNGIPTIPTMRQIGVSSTFMTDLTEGGKYRIDGFTKGDLFGGNRVKIFGSSLRDRLFEAKSKRELQSILVEKFEEIRKICIAKGVEVTMVDGFFIKLRNGKATITKDEIDIIIGDLDNVSIVGLGKGGIPYDNQYLADIFIKHLTN